MNKIRVLIVSDSLRIGGSERQAVELAKCLDRGQFAPIFACLQMHGPLLEELPGDLLGREAFPFRGFASTAYIQQSMRFVHFLRRMRVHVVQCFDFYSNLFAIPLARLAGVPVVLGARREGTLTKTPAQRTLQGICYWFSTGVVANAVAIKELVVHQDHIPAERVWVIRNGVDLNRFPKLERPSSLNRGSCAETIRIGVVANLRPEKGHLVLLDAAKQLVKRFPNVSFWIAGDGSMRREIESSIRELSLSERFQLLGWVQDIPNFLRNIDIAVLPSMSEAFPNAVMETMAASLPVVATDIGGTRELVIDGETGFLVSPNDSSALADRIGRLCSGPEVRLRMGEAGRRRVAEQFSADRMARRFENLYWELLKGRKNREFVTGADLDSPLRNPIENHAAQKWKERPPTTW